MLAENNPYLFGKCTELPSSTHTKRYLNTPFVGIDCVEATLFRCVGCDGCLAVKSRNGSNELQTVKWFKTPRSVPPEHFYPSAIKVLLRKIKKLKKEPLSVEVLNKLCAYYQVALLSLYSLRPRGELYNLDNGTITVIENEVFSTEKNKWENVLYQYGNDAPPPSSAEAAPYGDELCQLTLLEHLFNILSVCKFL